MRYYSLLLVSSFLLMFNNIYATPLSEARVLSFYDYAFNKKDVRKALDYVTYNYIEHDPTVMDGKKGLREQILNLQKNYPDETRSYYKLFSTDNDYDHFVVLHIETKPTKAIPGKAIIEIYKMDENWQISEHWNVVQDIPMITANSNGMF